jgi:hypothetical protein
VLINPPVKPAKLHTPWKEAIILRRYKRSTPTPCVFTEILQRFPNIPKINSPAERYKTEEAKPIFINAAG